LGWARSAGCTADAGESMCKAPSDIDKKSPLYRALRSITVRGHTNHMAFAQLVLQQLSPHFVLEREDREVLVIQWYHPGQALWKRAGGARRLRQQAYEILSEKVGRVAGWVVGTAGPRWAPGNLCLCSISPRTGLVGGVAAKPHGCLPRGSSGSAGAVRARAPVLRAGVRVSVAISGPFRAHGSMVFWETRGGGRGQCPIHPQLPARASKGSAPGG
jgi:hypothetical protein